MQVAWVMHQIVKFTFTIDLVQDNIYQEVKRKLLQMCWNKNMKLVRECGVIMWFVSGIPEGAVQGKAECSPSPDRHNRCLTLPPGSFWCGKDLVTPSPMDLFDHFSGVIFGGLSVRSHYWRMFLGWMIATSSTHWVECIMKRRHYRPWFLEP